MTSKHYTLFGMPVFQEEIDPKLYNKKQLIEDIEYNYNISKQRGSDFGKWHDSYECTDDRFKKIQSDDLIKVYAEKLKEFCGNYLKLNKNYALKIEIINYTCNKEDSFMILQGCSYLHDLFQNGNRSLMHASPFGLLQGSV